MRKPGNVVITAFILVLVHVAFGGSVFSKGWSMSGEQKPTDKKADGTEIATLGGGCFWCLEAVFEDMQGVKNVVSGYAGGRVKNPSYQDVCTGKTGHAEVVKIEFDPGVVSYEELLNVFFTIHDPTTPDRQGADIGSQYRSVIFYHDDDQRKVAERVIRGLESSGKWGRPVVTELVPFTMFYEAEKYHQDYFEKNPDAGYCQAVVVPKVLKFRESFPEKIKPSK